MKKILAALLAALLLFGMFTFAAAADETTALASSISVHKGFAKHNADVFEIYKAENPSATFIAGDNNQFSINAATGKLTFKTGPASLSAVEVTVTTDAGQQTVEVKTYYEWYEYLVIVFAAGWFWIAAVNN